jgi:hypothetical protein
MSTPDLTHAALKCRSNRTPTTTSSLEPRIRPELRQAPPKPLAFSDLKHATRGPLNNYARRDLKLLLSFAFV